jgi:peptidoglycan hydrolase CwlO-like protein
MLDMLKDRLMGLQNHYEELVKKYDEKAAEIKKNEAELTQIEKELIHMQGAIEALNSVGMELMEKGEQAPETIAAEQVEIVEQ